MEFEYAAHRGYKALYPENTLNAFQAAYDAKCQVIETDVHITSDDEIVIAHDIDTNRVFGKDYIITETPWKNKLEHLRTLETPRSPMPLLKEVLNWVAKIWDQEKGHVKLMLDIKIDNDPVRLFSLMWQLFDEIKGIEFWKDKIIWGIWAPSFLLPEYLQGWQIINITFDMNVAVSINEAAKEKGLHLTAVSIFGMIIYNKSEGEKLLKWVEEQDLKIWFWTLNKRNEVLDAVKFTKDGKYLAGVITDDPVAAMGETEIGNETSISYTAKWWIRKQLYCVLLFLSRKRYNLKYVFYVLKKVGFI